MRGTHTFVLLGGAAVAMLAHNAYLQPWTLDDAFISFRYAENFAHGDGLVYNPGERVEGYTNFLWVFLLGVAHAVGLPTSAMAKVLGSLCAVGCLALTAAAHRLHPRFTPRASAAATVLLGTTGIFTVWVMSGMEVPLAALLVLAAVLLHYRSRTGDAPLLGAAAGACCALAAMTHPELGLLFGVLLLDRVRRGRRSWGPFAAVYVALYVPYFAWRYAYYGWLLPNTFYNKVGGTWDQVLRGFRYIGGFCWPALPLLAPVLVSAVMPRSKLPWLILFYAVVHAVFVLLVGGDVMPAFRFFSPLAPLGCLLAAVALDQLVRPRRRYAVVIAAMVAFSVMQVFVHRDIHDRVIHGKVGSRGREMGLWLRDNAPQHAVLATNTAGSVAYYSGLTTIDSLGLADEHIAHVVVPMGKRPAGHEKHDGVYVLDREPDYIMFGSGRGSEKARFPGDKEIWRDPRFKKQYELLVVDLESGHKGWLYRRVE